MPYTGAVNGSPVNVVGIHRNDDVLHDLVNGERKLMEVAVQLVNVSVIIVGRVCELLQAAKLYDHHRHKPVSEKYNNKNDSRGLPQTEVCSILKKSDRLATSPPCMWWAAVTNGSPYLQVVGEMHWNGSPSPHFVFVGHVQSELSAGVAQIKMKVFKALCFIS